MTNDAKYADWMDLFIPVPYYVAKFEKKAVGNVRI